MIASDAPHSNDSLFQKLSVYHLMVLDYFTHLCSDNSGFNLKSDFLTGVLFLPAWLWIY